MPHPSNYKATPMPHPLTIKEPHAPSHPLQALLAYTRPIELYDGNIVVQYNQNYNLACFK